MLTRATGLTLASTDQNLKHLCQAGARQLKIVE
jgi:hypothetical protein